MLRTQNKTAMDGFVASSKIVQESKVRSGLDLTVACVLGMQIKEDAEQVNEKLKRLTRMVEILVAKLDATLERP
jgi:hypothetical protein